ncbi:MAG TPA: hypothetical protein VGH27_23585 [Streptosporangiaceae bacterium]|jgi:hypothetical protein
MAGPAAAERVADVAVPGIRSPALIHHHDHGAATAGHQRHHQPQGPGPDAGGNNVTQVMYNAWTLAATSS